MPKRRVKIAGQYYMGPPRREEAYEYTEVKAHILATQEEKDIADARFRPTLSNIRRQTAPAVNAAVDRLIERLNARSPEFEGTLAQALLPGRIALGTEGNPAVANAFREMAERSNHFESLIPDGAGVPPTADRVLAIHTDDGVDETIIRQTLRDEIVAVDKSYAVSTIEVNIPGVHYWETAIIFPDKPVETVARCHNVGSVEEQHARVITMVREGHYA